MHTILKFLIEKASRDILSRAMFSLISIPANRQLLSNHVRDALSAVGQFAARGIHGQPSEQRASLSLSRSFSFSAFSSDDDDASSSFEDAASRAAQPPL
jgi:hypothetical protein